MTVIGLVSTILILLAGGVLFAGGVAFGVWMAWKISPFSDEPPTLPEMFHKAPRVDQETTE